jgi:hypothetical protein
MIRIVKKCKYVITEAVRDVLYAGKMSQSQLATLCNVTPRAVYIQFNNGFKSKRMRSKVEWALQVPFWSSPEEWTLRLALSKRFDSDLFLLTLPGLRKLAVKHGIKNWKAQGGYISRQDLLRGFVEKLQRDEAERVSLTTQQTSE